MTFCLRPRAVFINRWVAVTYFLGDQNLYYSTIIVTNFVLWVANYQTLTTTALECHILFEWPFLVGKLETILWSLFQGWKNIVCNKSPKTTFITGSFINDVTIFWYFQVLICLCKMLQNDWSLFLKVWRHLLIPSSWMFNVKILYTLF